MGHAGQLQAWGELVADHLDHSPRLQLAVMLVGCTRGPCAVDRQVLRHIGRAGVPLLPVLTKADLLAPEEPCRRQRSAAEGGEGTRGPDHRAMTRRDQRRAGASATAAGRAHGRRAAAHAQRALLFGRGPLEGFSRARSAQARGGPTAARRCRCCLWRGFRTVSEYCTLSSNSQCASGPRRPRERKQDEPFSFLLREE